MEREIEQWWRGKSDGIGERNSPRGGSDGTRERKNPRKGSDGKGEKMMAEVKRPWRERNQWHIEKTMAKGRE